MSKLRTLGRKLAPSQRVKVRLPAKEADPFYNSVSWRALVSQIIEQRGHRCEDPEHDETKPRTGVRVHGDHIKERRDGGAPLDKRNVMLRCTSCHTRKTLKVRAARYQIVEKR